MGKGRDPLEALKEATAARAAFLEKHPDYPETGRRAKQSPATEKAPEQAPAETQTPLARKGAAAREFRDRKMLPDY